MSYANPSQTYRQVATLTASPGQLVLNLYDGAIRFLDQALQGFHQSDPLQFNLTIHNNVKRAQAILRSLDNALNMQAGGKLSFTLRELYGYFDKRLQESNLTKQEEGIQEVISRLTELREAWSRMLREGGASQTECAPLSVEDAA